MRRNLDDDFQNIHGMVLNILFPSVPVVIGGQRRCPGGAERPPMTVAVTRFGWFSRGSSSSGLAILVSDVHDGWREQCGSFCWLARPYSGRAVVSPSPRPHPTKCKVSMPRLCWVARVRTTTTTLSAGPNPARRRHQHLAPSSSG